MRSIRLNLDEDYQWPEDVKVIIRAFREEGLYCSAQQAHWMWQEYSDSMCAGWMTVHEDDENIVSKCRAYFTEVGMD